MFWSIINVHDLIDIFQKPLTNFRAHMLTLWLLSGLYFFLVCPSMDPMSNLPITLITALSVTYLDYKVSAINYKFDFLSFKEKLAIQLFAFCIEVIKWTDSVQVIKSKYLALNFQTCPVWIIGTSVPVCVFSQYYFRWNH